jgi:hypothetical protein
MPAHHEYFETGRAIAQKQYRGRASDRGHGHKGYSAGAPLAASFLAASA